MSYFLAGVPYILWDNIKRGTQIDCPHIERSCTAAYYADRQLGVSEMVGTAASMIHFFTGNAIGPKGDLASRSLKIWLDADRPIQRTAISSITTPSDGPTIIASRYSRPSTRSCSATRC